MKKMLAAFAMLAMIFAVAQSASADDPLNNLYGQEGTEADGYEAINAAGMGPAVNPNSTNWKRQFGGTHMDFAVYSWDSSAWVEEWDNDIDGSIDIEADIEMFYSQTITNPKLYFHFGDVSKATADQKSALVAGTFASNNGQYIGISFAGTTKTEEDFNRATGIITDAMVGTTDAGGRLVEDAFDARFLMTWGEGYQTPGSFGAGAHETIPATLWWLVNEGAPGAYNLVWKIDLLPTAYQKDGNYNLDPIVVAMPVL